MNGNGKLTERNSCVLLKRSTEIRLRMNGNVTLEIRRNSKCLYISVYCCQFAHLLAVTGSNDSRVHLRAGQSDWTSTSRQRFRRRLPVSSAHISTVSLLHGLAQGACLSHGITFSNSKTIPALTWPLSSVNFTRIVSYRVSLYLFSRC